MPFINSSAGIGAVISNVSVNILGSDALTGLWLLILMFGVMAALGMSMSLAILALVPLSILFIAYGFITPLAGGLVILAAGVIVAYNFFNKA